MSQPYRVFGAELSPYSVKVRSYFRYKGIPHRWIERNLGNMPEFQKYARLPLIPLVITPEGEGVQDSTPILERFDAAFPEPPLHPSDSTAAFVSALLEEYADEWGNKHMFHYRWTYPADQASAARRLAESNLPGAEAERVAAMAQQLVERMVPRLSFVGSNEATRDQIEASYRRLLQRLAAHLADRPFLFGSQPALADFGLFAQLYECSIDPTAGELLRAGAPPVLDWVERMLDPEPVGQPAFEDWGHLAPTLEPLLREEVAGLFLPWSTANARALAAGEPEFQVELEGRRFTQQTQKYHARSLAKLRERYASVADRRELDPVLERTGCLRWLQ